MYSAKLFFELDKPDGSTVSQVEWRDFEKVLVQHLPNFSIADSTGYYAYRERHWKIVTSILEGGAESIEKVDTVAKAYCAAHGFDSVRTVNCRVDTRDIQSEALEHRDLERWSKNRARMSLKRQLPFISHLLKTPNKWVICDDSAPDLNNEDIHALVKLGIVERGLRTTWYMPVAYKVKLKSIEKANDFINTNKLLGE